jgi:hypothetical protein
MRERLWQAGPATLLVFLITSLCTANSVMVMAMRVPSAELAESSSVLALYTLVKLVDAIAPTPLRYTALPGLTLLVCAPLLQVLWLRALQQRGSLPEHAHHAKGMYRHAAALHLTSLAYTALLMSLGIGLAQLVASALAEADIPGFALCLELLVAVPPWLAALCHGPSVVDRLQLELARGATLDRPLLIAALREVDLRVCATRAGFGLVALACTALALLPRVWLGVASATAWAAWASWLLWAAALAGSFARTTLRAAWLAWLTERVLARDSTPAP